MPDMLKFGNLLSFCASSFYFRNKTNREVVISEKNNVGQINLYNVTFSFK